MPDAELNVIVLTAFTFITPVFVITPHPPVNVMVYVNVPDAVGVPLIVTTLFNHAPSTPAGKPAKVAPVAPVVVYVALVIAVFIQTVCDSVPDAELNVIVLLGVTTNDAVVLATPQPPVVDIINE